MKSQARPNLALTTFLVLLLALAPLWAPVGMAATDLSATSSAQMSCCPIPDTESAHHELAGSETCTHCSGDAPAGQCQCCPMAAATALPSKKVCTHLHTSAHFSVQIASVTLPSPPYQAPFRPPIDFT